MSIQILSDDVISQIAAGEVVERPASVVKELIENALDAGAQNIHIDVVQGGQKRIRISDDGGGIPADEVLLAITRHATSKLRYADDLQTIKTLGFRGEALSSIASVSRLSLVTRHRDESIGTEIRVEGGALINQKGAGAPAGTVITVDNLFFNTPARLKFLKSENTEKRHIASIVTHYAMAYPSVRFALLHDGREFFRSSGSGQLSDVVVKVFGLENFKQMLEVRGTERIHESGDDIVVHGFVSQPNLNRKDRTRIILFVNGRAVQDSGLTYAVTQAYHTLMDKGRHPYAVLMLQVPPDFVDVNVHPTKAEVRFQDTNTIFTAVQRTVRRAIVGFAQAERHGGYSAGRVEREGWSLPYKQEEARDQLDMGFDPEPVGKFTDVPDPSEMTEAELARIPEGRGRPENPRTLPLLRVVGQIGAAYIVAEGPAGMYLIDQYAAHTRVLYTELKAVLKQQGQVPHRELQSQTLDVNPNEARLIERQLERLSSLGVILEAFGATTFMIRGIPAIFQVGDPPSLVWSLVECLQQAKGDVLTDLLLVQIARLAAVKSGKILDTDDMRSLVRKLEYCPDPLVDPDGKPTLIHMSADHLAREFGRVNRAN